MSPKKPNSFERFLAERSKRERTSVLVQPNSPKEYTRDQEAEGVDVEGAIADRCHEKWKTESKRDGHSADKQNSSKIAGDHRSAMANRICDGTPKDSEECIRDRRDNYGERRNQRGSCLHVADIRQGNQRYRIAEPTGDLSKPECRETWGSKRTKRHDIGARGHRALVRRKT